jgi:hypothetical protein
VTIASFQDYLPLGDLVKIIVVCLAVAIVAPTAAGVAIIGLDRRARAEARGASVARAQALTVVGLGVLAALVVAGIYALAN